MQPEHASEESWSEVGSHNETMSHQSNETKKEEDKPTVQLVDSIDDILAQANLPAAHLTHIQTVLYGKLPTTLAIDPAATKLAEEHDFELKGYAYPVVPREMSPPRMVRIGMIQNAIAKPTTAPYVEQWQGIVDTLEPMVDAAGAAGVNVLCLQEACSMPFTFCTREKSWCEFAEDAREGRTVQWARRKAAQYGMVIILPILERDTLMDRVWNTAVCIGHAGNYVGKSRKFHIPRVGDFNESTYYMEGNTGWPVFQTKFGKIGVPICYSRHFPNTYLAHALSGAEILFNPSATVAGLSENLWWTEQAANAVATSTFVGQINRVGTETMPHEFTSGDGRPAHADFGHFYGTTMLTLPDGSRTPPLSRTRNGLLVAEVDLNLQQATRDKWCFNMTGRLGEYGELYCAAANDPNFEPQLVVDPNH